MANSEPMQTKRETYLQSHVEFQACMKHKKFVIFGFFFFNKTFEIPV